MTPEELREVWNEPIEPSKSDTEKELLRIGKILLIPLSIFLFFFFLPKLLRYTTSIIEEWKNLQKAVQK